MTDKLLETVYARLKEIGLPKSALKKHGILEENITDMSWETALKLAVLLKTTPEYLIYLAWQYHKKGAKG